MYYFIMKERKSTSQSSSFLPLDMFEWLILCSTAFQCTILASIKRKASQATIAFYWTTTRQLENRFFRCCCCCNWRKMLFLYTTRNVTSKRISNYDVLTPYTILLRKISLISYFAIRFYRKREESRSTRMMHKKNIAELFSVNGIETNINWFNLKHHLNISVIIRT